MEAFSAILERRLQLTVRTLGQAVRTPSGILIITFYSNIGLGQNRRRWKANEKWCKFMVRKTSNRVRTAPVRTETSGVRTALRKFQNYFSDKEKVSRPDARASDSIFDSI
jgi:hypothetical protein